ncbi:MAG: response regulator [Alphaproteobacteria bacterium]|nr:response regulator [Alphaproteobacteria bacterium]
MNILVVDDEPEIVEEVCGFLQRRGFQPIAADGVTAAREALDATAAIDIVLTDMRMPTGSGLDVLQSCLQREPRPAMLVMTGQASEDEIRSAMDVGASAVLRKPLSLRQLLEMLKKVEADRA